MTQTKEQRLYDEFLAIADKGDEEAARKFLTDHLAKFPEETREKLTFAFFEEALEKKSREAEAIQSARQEGLETLKQVIKAQKEIDNTIRTGDLKNDLNKEE